MKINNIINFIIICLMIIYIRFLHLEIIDFRMDIERFTNKIDTYNSYNMDFLANTAKINV